MNCQSVCVLFGPHTPQYGGYKSGLLALEAVSCLFVAFFVFRFFFLPRVLRDARDSCVFLQCICSNCASRLDCDDWLRRLLRSKRGGGQNILAMRFLMYLTLCVAPFIETRHRLCLNGPPRE